MGFCSPVEHIMLDPEDIMDLTSYGKGKEILAKYDVTL